MEVLHLARREVILLKPDEAVEDIGEWGITTTRRTVLTYEKDKLAPPPYIETGKYKEYPKTFTAEFIASWCLIHGDYGLKPKVVAEVRKKAYEILYSFPDIWKREVPGVDNANSLYELVHLGTNWRKPCDFFVFAWIMVRTAILYCNHGVLREGFEAEDAVENLKEEVICFINTGSFKHLPRLNICSSYNLSGGNVTRDKEKINLNIDVNSRGYIKIEFTDVEGNFITPREVADAWDFGDKSIKAAGFQDVIFIKYVHPEDLIMDNPVY